MNNFKNLNIKLLINLGAHIGHAKIDWNSNNKAYLAGMTNNKHIIFNINKTLFFFKRALTFLRLVGYNGGKFVIYFPGEDPFYKSMMEAVLDREGLLPSKYPFIHSFVKPGFFSNWRTNYKQFVKQFFKIIFWNPYFFSALATQLFYHKLDKNTLLNQKYSILDRLNYLIKLKRNKLPYYKETIRNLRVYRKVKRTNFRTYAESYKFPNKYISSSKLTSRSISNTQPNKYINMNGALDLVDLHFLHQLDFIFLQMSHLRIIDLTSYIAFNDRTVKINFNSIKMQKASSKIKIGINKYRSIDNDFWFSKLFKNIPPAFKKVFMLYSYNSDPFIPSVYDLVKPTKLFTLIRLMDRFKLNKKNKRTIRIINKFIEKLLYRFNMETFCKKYLRFLYLKDSEQQKYKKISYKNSIDKCKLVNKNRKNKYRLPLIGSSNEFTTRKLISNQLHEAKRTKIHPKYTANKINTMIYSYISKMSREHKKSSIVTPNQIVRTDAFKMLYYNIYNLLVNIAMHNHKYNSKRDTLSPHQQLLFRRFIRFTVIFRYLKRLMKVPSAVILLNSDVHESQYSDFQNLNAAVIGLLDSNISFRSLSYFIPTNDDSIVLFLYYVKMFGYAYTSGYKSRFLDLLIPKLVNNVSHEHTYPNFFLNYGSQYKDHKINAKLTKSPNPLRQSYDLLASASNMSDYNHLQKLDLKEQEKQKAREEYFKWKDAIRHLKQRIYGQHPSNSPFKGKGFRHAHPNNRKLSTIHFKENNLPMKQKYTKPGPIQRTNNQYKHSYKFSSSMYDNRKNFNKNNNQYKQNHKFSSSMYDNRKNFNRTNNQYKHNQYKHNQYKHNHKSSPSMYDNRKNFNSKFGSKKPH